MQRNERAFTEGESEGYGACIDDAPLAQLVEQLTLNQWVLGSSPRRRTKWPVGQAVKTAASHAANMGSIPVRVTTVYSAREKKVNST